MPSGTVGGSVKSTAKVPEPLLCVFPPELVVLLTEDVVVDFGSSPGVSTSPVISATAITVAMTPESRALFLLLMSCRSLRDSITPDCIRNSHFERFVQPVPPPF